MEIYELLEISYSNSEKQGLDLIEPAGAIGGVIFLGFLIDFQIALIAIEIFQYGFLGDIWVS